MKETPQQAIGRIARLRRERLGLKQEQLARYGGPKVSTVGKFERASEESFPPRTQHAMENALGWSRTTIEQFMASWADWGLGDEMMQDWERQLVDDDVPDLTNPTAAGGDDSSDPQVRSLAAVLRVVPEAKRFDALVAALAALASYVNPSDLVSDPTGTPVHLRPVAQTGDLEQPGEEPP